MVYDWYKLIAYLLKKEKFGFICQKHEKEL